MWYYVSGGQQAGPFDDAAFDRLIDEQTVTDETFVWKEGQPEWKPFRELRLVHTAHLPATTADVCSRCGKDVGADNLIDLLGLRVCAACKPIALQAFREGATPALNTTAWREGKKVVTYNGKALPARCFKCNEPAAGAPLKRKLYWHSGLFYLLIFINIILYAIVAILVRKRATVDVHLCDRHLQLRKIYRMIGWGGAVLTVPMIIGGIATSTNMLIVPGTVLLVAALITAAIGTSVTRAVLIKNDTVWLGGAGHAFLASLPDWP